MSLFDFPRIHFKGNVDVNVPTINNAYYFPLTIYDATRSKPLLPPRLYFSSEELIQSVQSNLNPTIIKDDINGYFYIEIEPVNTIEILRKWCETPVCMDNNSVDIAYKPFYTVAETDLEPAPIVGQSPGYWNMYGDMTIAMSEVNVTGVQAFNNDQIQNYNQSSEDIPADVKPFLNASFNLDTKPKGGMTTASMVDTISSQGVYSNVFCSKLNLFNTDDEDEVFLTGVPFKFSASIYSAWRVVNWMPPMAGSGRFCSAVPLEEISDEEQSALVKFFNANKAYDTRELKGVFVTFTILEVFENRYDQSYYLKNGTKPNPAQCTTIGSITPWYEGDLKAGNLGRHLISKDMSPIFMHPNPGGPTKPNIPISFAPVVSSLNVMNENLAVFSIDMGNTWPEEITILDPTKDPAHRGDGTFETYNLGTLSFRYGDDICTEFSTLEVSSDVNPLSVVASKGCVFDFIITDSNVISEIQNGLIQVYAHNKKANPELSPVKVLTESPYMITSDQRGLYGEQGELPTDGYRVYSNKREPYRVRIFAKGKPVTEPINIGIAEFSVPESGNDPLGGANAVNWVNLKDNDIVELTNSAIELKDNAIFYFVYENQYENNVIPPFVVNNSYTVMDTGSFAVLRVHPIKDYSQYTNPENWDKTPPTYEVVYEEVFKLYDVVYPIMAEVHPFTPEVWDNGIMAGMVLQRVDPNSWNDILYMPKSRELSSAQYKLLQAWAAYTKQNNS